jgi:hypothetical protein
VGLARLPFGKDIYYSVSKDIKKLLRCYNRLGLAAGLIGKRPLTAACKKPELRENTAIALDKSDR